MILKLKPDIKCPWAGAVLQAEAVLQTFQQNAPDLTNKFLLIF